MVTIGEILSIAFPYTDHGAHMASRHVSYLTLISWCNFYTTVYST